MIAAVITFPPAARSGDRMQRRWWIWIGAVVVLAMALALATFYGGSGTGAQASAEPNPVCTSKPAVDPRAGAAHAWWRITDRTDASGSLVGRLLEVGTASEPNVSLQLDRESMASGPVGGIVVATSDDRASSTVLLVDAVAGCWWRAHSSVDVVRSAHIDVAANATLEHVIQRSDRADAGIWRITSGEASNGVLILKPLVARPAFGPIASTEVRLDPSGGMIAVQSCSDAACLTRIKPLDDPLAEPFVIDDPDQGQVIAYIGTQLITWQWCLGFPCPIVAWSTETGAMTTLVENVVAAAVTGDGRTLVAVTDTDPGQAVRVDLATGLAQDVGGIHPNELPISERVSGYAGLEVEPDEIALGAENGTLRPFAPRDAPNGS